MLVGLFGDTHDHIDNVRHAVNTFNHLGCEYVLFAGDLVSPLVIPPLRRLRGKFIACWGDNDGNRIGIAGGLRIIGEIGEPPFCIQTPDGVRILLTHNPDMARNQLQNIDVVVSSHTHRAHFATTASGMITINPGECSGWISRKPQIAVLDTTTRKVEFYPLPEPPPVPDMIP
ncbi:phosphodiesterase [Polystyrenella longa]|uniref:Phosphoesterase n=1 Tax=Polystyrenella longa TaxID=2528007 RepID=A0A518CPC8_9PLAN|nr:YfcE family phosphodiesterase [Polystyrenella longa]QDU81072.1 phosphodiesterase [Polystyrenella longa]